MKLSRNDLPKLIGLAGTFAGGKDTLAQYLVREFGYTHVSTGDMVREIARQKYGSIERPILAKTADELRHEKGAGVLVQEAIARHAETDKLIVSGIRSLGEVKTLRDHHGVLVFVDADPKIRYERMISRQRDSETKLIFAEFLANEQKELHSGDSDADFNIAKIRDTADIILDNSSSENELFAQATGKLARYN